MATAESSSSACSADNVTISSSSSSSAITHIAQDHLFSILLLLPVDSILSFSMTCTRFRSLGSSPTLWESIFRRDFGDDSVNALKFTTTTAAAATSDTHIVPVLEEANSDPHRRHRRRRRSHHTTLPQNWNWNWMKLYRQVYQLDAVFCHRLTDPGGEIPTPKPRASHSLNLVSGCLILFGGGSEGGRHLDDTWVAYIGDDLKSLLKWQRISSGIPNGRFGHTCVVLGNSLILFGGINDHGVRQNDTWIGQLIWDDTLGFTLLWRLLDVGNVAPLPRGAHAGCYIDNMRMVIHGGIGVCGLRLGDTWILDISENLCFGMWHEVISHPSPPARSGHTMTCVGRTQTVLFGGRGSGYEVLNDVWMLDISDGHLKWVKILYDLQDIPEGPSLARVGHSATLVIGGKVLIHGGEDSYRQRKDDFWLLDITAFQPTKTLPLKNKGLLSVKLWKRLKSKGFKLNCRSFHRSCVDPTGRYMYMFGGMLDGLVQQSESSGLRFDGELFLVELML